MKFATFAGALLASTVLMAACSQSEAPSDELEEAAVELVDAVLDNPPPAGDDALGPLAPRNACGELDGAADFLAMLNGAVATRDSDVLVALAADDVKLGFGGEDGADNLRASLNAEGSVLWEELSELVSLGCAENAQGGLTLPWYFAQNLQLDPFESFIVASDNAPLHGEPREASPRLAILDWQEVELRRGENGSILMGGNPEVLEESWYGVRVPADGDSEAVDGFVRASQLRSAIDYRLIAASRNGRWRITALLAGD